MHTFWVRREDYTSGASWRLLDWCLSHGAGEFRLTLLGPPDSGDGLWADVESVLAPFRVAVGPSTEIRYRLAEASIAALGRVMDEGLFTYDCGLRSLEDPTVFRDGEVLLEVITHEGEGYLRLEPAEQASLDIAGLPYHLKSRWE